MLLLVRAPRFFLNPTRKLSKEKRKLNGKLERQVIARGRTVKVKKRKCPESLGGMPAFIDAFIASDNLNQ